MTVLGVRKKVGLPPFIWHVHASLLAMICLAGLGTACATSDRPGPVSDHQSNEHSAEATKLPFDALNAIAAIAVNASGDVTAWDEDKEGIWYLPAGSPSPSKLTYDFAGAPRSLDMTDAGGVYTTDYGGNPVVWHDASSQGTDLPINWASQSGLIAVDNAQNFYVTFGDASIVRYGSDYQRTKLALGDTRMTAVNGLATAGNGDLYALGWIGDDTDNSAVIRFPRGIGTPELIALNLGDCPDLTITPDGSIYVVQSPGYSEENGKLLRVSPGSATATEVTTVSLPYPREIESDSRGNLYAAINTNGKSIPANTVIKFGAPA